MPDPREFKRSQAIPHGPGVFYRDSPAIATPGCYANENQNSTRANRSPMFRRGGAARADRRRHQTARARHFQAAHRNQYDRFGRQHDRRRAGHGRAPARCRISRERRRKFSARTTAKAIWSRGCTARARTPILLIGHLDVVEARREDWSIDPFQFIERDGYFYGRGTQDMKDGDAILVATLIRLKQGGLHAGSRHHPRADRRRRRRKIKWRRLAAAKSSRFDRRRIRAESRWRRCLHAQRQAR